MLGSLVLRCTALGMQISTAVHLGFIRGPMRCSTVGKESARTSTNQAVGYKDLLRVRPRHTPCSTPSPCPTIGCTPSTTRPSPSIPPIPPSRRSRPRLAVLPSGRAHRARACRVAFRPLDEDRADIVDGNVDGVCDARDGQDALV